jgi:hypothetical protein
MSWIGERLTRRWRVLEGDPVRYTPPPPAPPPPRPEPSILSRLMFWKAVVRAEAQRAPSVDQVQARDAQEQRRRVVASADAIARGVAEGGGAWFPGRDGQPRFPWS